ncbi:unnamed protein product [Trifolium pratense]|uniref:Uncharacterized protein n=1 Tax=Trifolium pratense TaxID=57577 RepID=A0ACB0K0U2_TRIPR|nr:unnamed protein product [Trifolium pratense]
MNLSKDSPPTDCDLEAGSPNANARSADLVGEDNTSDPFDISRTKNASIQRLNRWRQAAFVLNASRRFHYTLDLKKEEERKQILWKIIVHIRAIQVCFLNHTTSSKL